MSTPSSLNTKKSAGPRPRTTWTYIRWTAAVMFCTVAVAVGVVAGSFYWGSKTIRNGVKTWIGDGSLNPLNTWTIPKQLPVDKQHSATILLMGCDHDYEDRRPVPILSTPGRSDALMIARLNFDTNTINVMSIPRDTAVHVPDHRGIKKINSAHSLGGAELTRRTIKEVFGIDCDYYVGLNFENFQQIVDAIGGVDVNIDKKLDYDDNWGNLHVHLKPGFQHLDGYKAMGYVRIRHTDDDFHRQERQHAFLVAMQKQVENPMVFLQKMPGALDLLTRNIETDLTTDQLLALGNFARQVPKENIQLVTMPSVMGRSFVYIDVPKSAVIVRKMFFNDDQYADVTINAPDRSDTPGRHRVIQDGDSIAPTHHRRRRRHDSALPSPETSQPTDSPPNLDDSQPAIDNTNPPAHNNGGGNDPGAPGAPDNTTHG